MAAKHYHIKRTATLGSDETTIEARPLMFRTVRSIFRKNREFWGKQGGMGLYYEITTEGTAQICTVDPIFSKPYEVGRLDYVVCNAKLESDLAIKGYMFKKCSAHPGTPR